MRALIERRGEKRRLRMLHIYAESIAEGTLVALATIGFLISVAAFASSRRALALSAEA